MHVNVEYEDIFDDDSEIMEIIENGFPKRMIECKNYFRKMDDYTTLEKVIFVLEQIYHILEHPNDVKTATSQQENPRKILTIQEGTTVQVTCQAEYPKEPGIEIPRNKSSIEDIEQKQKEEIAENSQLGNNLEPKTIHTDTKVQIYQENEI
ncbi:hypothetical protein JTB14_009557 [Gonioctena quinquepunctata]|nr:hypothetical protein JTB14_009557 [Gonioctena quinquepunctata]